jgi:hypothetical protein
MRVLGIKCAKQELSWIVVDGTARIDATVVAFDRVKAPAGERGEQLTWARKEIFELLNKHTPEAAALGMSEGANSLAERSQMDGIVLGTMHEKSVTVERLFSSSIRSRFTVRKLDEIKPLIAALPCASSLREAQRSVLTLALAMFPS